MTGPVIEIRDLWFSYNGQPILQDVDLAVRAGDFLAVIGPNGGGKTTLLKLMMGLLKPDRGRVRVLGAPPQKASHRIGYVPQDIHANKNFPISVEDVVLMGRLRQEGLRFRYSGKDREAVEKVLKQVDMWNLRERRMGELSGGQRQRAFIARALASDPELLFLDEPTSSVDQKGQTDLYALLGRLNERVTIVVVSHDLMVLSTYVKSVACVNRKLFFHEDSTVTEDMLEMGYQCPVELVTHGHLPHRVLTPHEDE